MSSRVRRFAVAGLLSLAVSQLWPIDLTEGRLRVTLYDGIGRFSIAYLSNTRENAYSPLLVAQDPRTSMLSIVVGNKVYRMGEGTEFAQSAEKTADGARFLWKSTLLTITESFSFVSSSASTPADGVRIDLTIRNTSRQDLNVGARYLFDTYLGEASFVHFRTNSLTDVTKELALSGPALPLYWVSPLPNDPEELGLQVMSSGEGITVPDRVVFANWKRLSDASWSYTVSAARNFNLLPYSVNDSAVCQYYEPRTVTRGSELTLTLCLGKFNAAGFALRQPAPAAAPVVAAAAPAPEPAPAQPASSPIVTPEPPAAPPALTAQSEAAAAAARAARAELSGLNALIVQIDASIAAGGAVLQADIERLRAALGELKSRASNYPATSGK
jgi:hypothetical protein